MPRHHESTLAAIKRAVDIVDLIGDYLPLHRSGSKFKALCPFHDDHNPSLELNSDRQSYKCWSCGAGGDVFDFVKEYERVDFAEALRMLAERAGVALDEASSRPATKGPSKTELLGAAAWAAGQFVDALRSSPEARAYADRRGISAEVGDRFGLGYAPESRDWLRGRARRAGIGEGLLEQVGLVVRVEDGPGQGPARVRERFRGRLIFPIRDGRGRVIAFGGRILPEFERKLAEAGRPVAKYLNSPETPLFQKRRTLYAADLARTAARQAGWVAVVEGYTDVIAAHQAGVSNVVGSLGTALGDEHVQALRRLADRAVLVFDGDEAGQKAADRALELFLGHEVDVRVLTLPDGLDPCDYLLAEGSGPFLELVGKAADPLEFAIGRAGSRFDLESAEGARQAAEWVLAVLGRVPKAGGGTFDIKVAKALDTLSRRLGVPVEDLRRRLSQLRKPKPAPIRVVPGPGAEAAASDPAPPKPIRTADLNPIDRELIEVVLNEPALVGRLITRVAAADLRDAPLRAILDACYDLYSEGQSPDFDHLANRLDEPERALAAGLLLPIDPQPSGIGVRPAAWDVRLAGVLARFAERGRQERLRDLEGALKQADPGSDPEQYRALRLEYHRLLNQRPDTKSKTAS